MGYGKSDKPRLRRYCKQSFIKRLEARFANANDYGEHYKAESIHLRSHFLIRSMQVVGLQSREGSSPDIINDYIERAAITCCSCIA